MLSPSPAKVLCVYLNTGIPIIVLAEGGVWKYPTMAMLQPAANGMVSCVFPPVPFLALAADKTQMPDLTGSPQVLLVADPDMNVRKAYLEGFLPEARMAASGLISPRRAGKLR